MATVSKLAPGRAGRPAPSRRAAAAAQVRPAPGPRYPAGMHRYVVLLKDDDAESATADAPVDRERFVRARERRVARFRQRLLRMIREEGLQAQVAEVTGPTAFNMLAIVGTKELASRVDHLDEVESVYRDRGLLHLVR